ncbi:hypothetical protein MQX03_12280 [Chryseobacterium aahli]|uniref:hypothetical protein n=1 Tax=Chryseobacterium aahli TaxID=1278643 RepID=UPI001F6023F9|nr:hypothetical protein [Chryseobacterium aahli]MCI3937980.1 hypothetical protein [Chryseobacterium aahli]
MKKIFFGIFLLAFSMFIFNSCEEHENLVYDGAELLHFDKKDQTLANGNGNITYGVTKAVSGDHNVELVFNPSKSTALLGTDFTFVESTDVLKSGSVLGDFVINVKPSAAAAKKQAVFTLKSSTLQNAVFNQEVLVKFTCPSALAGTYQYSTVNAFTPDGSSTTVPGPLTGSVVFTQVSDGVYQISDSSFGAFAKFPGYAPTSTGVRIQDLCNKLSFTTPNQYGDTFVISNVVVSGNKLTFKWTTSYGETATTTLTKSNGNWPALN